MSLHQVHILVKEPFGISDIAKIMAAPVRSLLEKIWICFIDRASCGALEYTVQCTHTCTLLLSTPFLQLCTGRAGPHIPHSLDGGLPALHDS